VHRSIPPGGCHSGRGKGVGELPSPPHEKPPRASGAVCRASVAGDDANGLAGRGLLALAEEDEIHEALEAPKQFPPHRSRNKPAAAGRGRAQASWEGARDRFFARPSNVFLYHLPPGRNYILLIFNELGSEREFFVSFRCFKRLMCKKASIPFLEGRSWGSSLLVPPRSKHEWRIRFCRSSRLCCRISHL
jgi:hypothetical protein